MEWTYHRIAELAPNSLVLGKAKGLARAKHWAEAGASGGLLWGLCKSSGERVYQVAASLDGAALRCSCSALYQPCRHALALLLYFIKPGAALAPSEAAPDWVHQLLKEAPARPLSAQEQTQRTAARAARFGQRLALMQGGVEDLEQWLLDLARQGLAAAQGQPDAFWESLAVRMTDAKLAGLARRIRGFKSITGSEDWHLRLLEELASLYLFVQSYQQWRELPEPLQEEIFNQAGIIRKREELLPLEGVADTWLAIGQLEGESEEDKLRYRRTWLLGEQRQRLALLLDFSWGQQGYEANWIAGSAVRGEAVYYPGAYPLRALLRQAVPSPAAFDVPPGYGSLRDFAQVYAEALAANPWLAVFPALFEPVLPLRESGSFWIADAAGDMLPLAAENGAAWKLLALSGGKPLKLFGEWDGRALRPLSVLLEQRLVPLQESSPEIDLDDF